MVQGRRKQAETKWTDAYCTPAWFAERIGRRDLDPCSNPRSHIDAAWEYMLEKGMDGLKLPWLGTVFENWPYSAPLPWAEKSIYEMTVGNCTDLIVLCKLDPSPHWWDVITDPVLGTLDRWDLNTRMQFDEHPEAIAERKRKRMEAIERGDQKIPPLKTSNNFASVVLHHRRRDAPMLNLWDVATLWRKVDPNLYAAAPGVMTNVIAAARSV